jgi:hypothetical protein
MLQSEPNPDEAAKRMSEKVDLWDFKRIQESRKIIHELFEGKPQSPGVILRISVPS